MRYERAGRTLFAAAALATGAPVPVQATGNIIWIEVCDPTHPGRKMPLPLDRDDPPAGKACHAACASLPDRRARR